MMMNRTKIDRAALSGELLDIAKSHLRVEFDRDDDYITLTISRAIDFFERATGLQVFPASYNWEPTLSYTRDGEQFFALPFQPAPSKFVVMDGATDISNQFAIRSIGGDPDVFAPRAFVALQPPMAAGQVVAVTVGYTDAEGMPPGILSFVLEATSWFYENRDAGPMPGADGVPYLNQLLTAYWVPKA